jgi:hypothetical protein
VISFGNPDQETNFERQPQHHRPLEGYSRFCDRKPVSARERVKRVIGTRAIQRICLFCPMADIAVRRGFVRGGLMANPLYRAERRRDPAEEYRAIPALCSPSTEMRDHYYHDVGALPIAGRGRGAG